MMLNELNPDAYSRFALTCQEIKRLGRNRTITILDIGGSSRYLYEFLSSTNVKFKLTVVDIVEYADKPEDVTFKLQSAEKLHDEDDTYDVVTAIDMLEHVPNNSAKQNIISEALRVSKDMVIIAGPCENDNVTRFERKLNKQNKRYFKQGQKWLEEHFRCGKPKLNEIKRLLQRNDAIVYSYTTLALSDWYISSLANLLTSVSNDISHKQIKAINKQYNNRFTSENRTLYVTQEDLGYRTFVIARKYKQIDQPNTSVPDMRLSLFDIEEYVDVLAEGIYRNRASAQLKKDILWHQKENVRLTQELSQVREALDKSQESLKTRAPRDINKTVQQLIKHQGKKK